jgi:hypothetical protein
MTQTAMRAKIAGFAVAFGIFSGIVAAHATSTEAHPSMLQGVAIADTSAAPLVHCPEDSHWD